MPSMRVLIAGAGIAGLAAAIALRQRGIAATLIERVKGWSEEGAGLYLVGNATRALRTLGLGERLTLAACLIRTQSVFSQRGACLGENDVDTFWKPCGPCLGVRRSRLSRPIDDPVDGRLERLRKLFADFAPRVREALDSMRNTDPVHFAPIEQVIQPVTARGRIVLIGDAAHAMSPSMASGAAMAFEDALVLATVLSAGGTIPSAVADFVQRRTARVEWIRSQTDRRDRLRKWPPALRNFVLRLAWSKVYAANYRPLLEPP